jgi:hypothetical protein
LYPQNDTGIVLSQGSRGTRLKPKSLQAPAGAVWRHLGLSGPYCTNWSRLEPSGGVGKTGMCTHELNTKTQRSSDRSLDETSECTALRQESHFPKQTACRDFGAVRVVLKQPGRTTWVSQHGGAFGPKHDRCDWEDSHLWQDFP